MAVGGLSEAQGSQRGVKGEDFLAKLAAADPSPKSQLLQPSHPPKHTKIFGKSAIIAEIAANFAISTDWRLMTGD